MENNMKFYKLSPKGLKAYNTSKNEGFEYFFSTEECSNATDLAMCWFGDYHGRMFVNLVTKEVIGFGLSDNGPDSYWKLISDHIDGLWIKDKEFIYWDQGGTQYCTNTLWFKNNVKIKKAIYI